MTGVRCGSGNRIPDDASPGSAWRHTGVPGATPPPGGRPYLSGLFPGGSGAPQMPSGGELRESNHTDQPQGSLSAPSHAGLHCDHGGGKMELPHPKCDILSHNMHCMSGTTPLNSPIKKDKKLCCLVE